MRERKQTNGSDTAALAEDVRALLAATAGVAGEEIREARRRLEASLAGGRTVFGRVRDKAIEGANATDAAVHEHPYPVIGIGFALGAAVMGYWFTRRRGSGGD